MCDNERKKLSIVGYEHPSSSVSRLNKKYKTLNTEDTQKNYTSSGQKSNYAKFSDNSSLILCPECGETAIMECGCDFKDRQCGKGHVWYINKKGDITKGDPHE
jgi:hypothetical protein